MKYIVVFLILFSGFSGVRAQDAYEQFRTEMKNWKPGSGNIIV